MICCTSRQQLCPVTSEKSPKVFPVLFQVGYLWLGFRPMDLHLSTHLASPNPVWRKSCWWGMWFFQLHLTEPVMSCHHCNWLSSWGVLTHYPSHHPGNLGDPPWDQDWLTLGSVGCGSQVAKMWYLPFPSHASWIKEYDQKEHYDFSLCPCDE